MRILREMWPILRFCPDIRPEKPEENQKEIKIFCSLVEIPTEELYPSNASHSYVITAPLCMVQFRA